MTSSNSERKNKMSISRLYKTLLAGTAAFVMLFGISMQSVSAAYHPGLIQAFFPDDPATDQKVAPEWHTNLLENVDEDSLDFVLTTIMTSKKFSPVTTPTPGKGYVNEYPGREAKEWYWEKYSTYAYEGEIYLELGKSYNFYVRGPRGGKIKINDVEIVNNTSVGNPKYQPYSRVYEPQEEGWHKINIIVWTYDDDQCGQYNNLFALGYSTTDLVERNGYGYDKNIVGLGALGKIEDWNTLTDPGDMTFLRFSDGSEIIYTDVLKVSGNPENIGEVEPAYGDYTTTTDSFTANCTVKTTSLDQNGSTWQINGYTLYNLDRLGNRTSVAESGPGSAYNFVFNGSKQELVWNWAPSTHTITVNSKRGGTFTTEGLDENNRCAHGAQVTLTAVPAEGSEFQCWKGDLPESVNPNDVSITFTAEASYTITPVFTLSYYLKKTSENPQAPYDSWETAADDLATVLAYAQNEAGTKSTIYVYGRHADDPANIDTTYVFDGTYLSITNPISLIGTGIAKPTFQSKGSFGQHGLFYINDEKALLKNLRIIDAFTEKATYSGRKENRAGAVLLENGTIEDCFFEKNIAGNRGGAICIYDGLVKDCLIAGNGTSIFGLGGYSGSRGNAGGGIAIMGGVVDNCVITNNMSDNHTSAAGCGAGVFISGGILKNSLVANNMGKPLKDAYGAGVYQTGGTIENCIIRDNTEAHGIGGVYMKGENAVIRNSSIVGNAATNDIGGIYVEQGMVINTLIEGNYAGGNIGGIFATGEKSKVLQSIIAKNSANHGVHGGIVSEGATIIGSTIVKNGIDTTLGEITATGVGFAVTNSTMQNTVVYFSENADSDLVVSETGSVIQNCCAPNLSSNDGNITAKPRFRDLAKGDYRTSAGSSCIDNGNNEFNAEEFDFYGKDRIFHGTIDIGASEYQRNHTTIILR